MEKIEAYPGIFLEINHKYINSINEMAKGKFDTDISRKNLIDLSTYFDLFNLKHAVIFGTLLGLYRDGDLIKHDYDVDIYILGEEYKKLIILLKNIKEIGFKIIRFEKRLISIERNQQYIDIYIFRKYLWFRKCGPNIIENSYLNKFSTLNLREKKINAPNNIEKFLERAYGTEWRIPIKGKGACITNLFFRRLLWLIAVFKSLFKLKTYPKIKNLIKSFLINKT